MFLNGMLANVFAFVDGIILGPDGKGGGEGRRFPVFMTPIEVAEMLKLSQRTLEKMRLESRGPKYYRLGDSGKSKVLYLLDEVMEWVERHKK